MSKVFAIIKDNKVIDRAIFNSFEDAESILGAGNFVEETEETGSFNFGDYWDGVTHIKATPEEINQILQDAATEYNQMIEELEASKQPTE